MSFLSQGAKNFQRATKIVATLGPASSDAKVIEALFDAGVNVFRINFSHGEVADHQARMDAIRKIETKARTPIAVLADLQGPKLRIGTFKDGRVPLKIGQKFTFDSDKAAGDDSRVCLPHKEVLETLKKGDYIYLDDGKVRAQVTKKSKGKLETKIIAGSALSDRKGFNLPGVVLPIPALTDKDKKDLKAALAMGADWIAQSFVQTADDVRAARKLVGKKAKLLVKVEKPAALDNLDEIMDLSDGVMIARGDLGVEIPPEDVPAVQKRMIQMARARGKPIIVATQMLESMISAPQPTRAEASDVATAIYDGTDAIMLSAETAAGEYPLESVQMMHRIACRVESDRTYRTLMDDTHPDADHGHISDAITIAADQVANTVGAVAIVTYTASGGTALRIARQRPERMILCLTQYEETARVLQLSYGVFPLHKPEDMEFEDVVKRAIRIAKMRGLAKKKDRLVITAGVPFGVPGSTNTLRVAEVD